MSKTYYDSELTGAQIESALEAIHGVVTPSNNGKVLYIEDGQIKAASASRWSGGAVLEPLSVTENGDYTPPTGTDGFDSVHVAVPSATLTTKSITANGTYNASQDDADGYSSVTVAVPGGATIEPLEVTENGTYNPPSGVDGYAPVTVNVSGGGDDPFALTNYIESSGTQYINTGYIVKDDTEFEMVVNFSNTGNYPTIFGVRAASQITASGLGSFICSRWANNTYASVNWGSSMINTQSLINHYGKKCLVEFNKGKKYSFESKDGYFVGGYFASTASATQNFPLYVFTLNTGGNIEAVNWCTMKLYRFRIFESGVLVHEFVPWQENGVACLKDTVTSEIKYNAGTGDFVYGTDA